MDSQEPKRRRRTPRTPEGRESQLISLAIDLVEKQLTNGTAAATVIVHYLKLATVRESLEQERLRNENLLLSAKVDNLASAKRVEALFKDAIDAFKGYSGQDDDYGTYDD